MTGPSSDQIDVLVYALNGVGTTPLGTIVIGAPEPASLAILGAALIGFGMVRLRTLAPPPAVPGTTQAPPALPRLPLPTP
jgi:PEP-CTERM motif